MMVRVLMLSVCLLLTSSLQAAKKDDGSHIQPDNDYPRVKLETSMGDIVVELNRYRAPISSNNFLRYVDKREYENTIFHRVISGFVVQGGGYTPDLKARPKFPAIINESGNGMTNDVYTLAMARQRDPHSANRQFYINVANNESLNPGRRWGYAVFGEVVEGFEVVDAISEVETQYNAVVGWNDMPVEPVMLIKATVLPQKREVPGSPPDKAESEQTK